nr:type VII secretion protein EccCa [Kineococcus xinjiangensis]
MLVHRGPRRPASALIGAPVRLSPPPPLADPTATSNWTYALFPVLGSAGMLVVALMRGNPLFLIAGAVFVLGSIAMGLAMFLQMRSRTRGQTFDGRVRYLRHLMDVRALIEANAAAQREEAATRHPAPAQLTAGVVQAGRVWERRSDDEDFLLLRVGVGQVPALHLPGLPEDDPSRPSDPTCAEAVQQLLHGHAQVAEVPVALPLQTGITTLIGTPARTRATARAMIASLLALHAPDDVRIAVCTPAGAHAVEEWEWLKWAPHARHPDTGGEGAGRLLLTEDASSLALLLDAELERRRAHAATGSPAGPALLVVIDGAVGESDPFAEVAALGVAQLRLLAFASEEPATVDVSLHLSAPSAQAPAEMTVVLRSPQHCSRTSGSQAGPEVQLARRAALELLGQTSSLHADELSLAEAEVLARRLSPLQLQEEATEMSLGSVSGLPDLLGIDDLQQLAPQQLWQQHPQRALLRVPIGVDAEGRPVELDLKESALGGMGPHGLVVGATGSGKSELLRTLVAGLALTHAPEDLALVLVDFKGGATFAGLQQLPHVAGALTDLEDDPDTVDRFAETLRGEMRRREELLRDCGNLASIREHRARRLAGADIAAMPHLLVVVDEFSELLAQKPEFIDLFVMIGRLGRSLGVHLLLATQRLEEGRLRGLDSHLSYRIALRTFSAAESRTVIGSADAFELPPVPGSAYLKVDTTVFQRLRAATVSAPYQAGDVTPVQPLLPRPRRFDAFAAGQETTAPLPALAPQLSDPNTASVLDVIAERLRGAAAPVKQVWLPPLPTSLPLHACLGRLSSNPERGYHASASSGGLRAPIGLIDLPERQVQGVYALDLAAAGGHLGIAGAPQSGKSTFLRTLVTSLALTHTPAEVQMYCIDLGGGALTGLEALPHVGVVASRQRPELVRRAIAQMQALLEAREQRFVDAGVESWLAYRAQRNAAATSSTPPTSSSEVPVSGDAGAAKWAWDAYGDVFLIVDGWSVLRSDFEDLEQPVTALAARGAAYGLHVIVSTARWFDLRPALRDSLGTKVELRLGDPAETSADRKAAKAMPTIPGRLLVNATSKVQVALPVTLTTLSGQPAQPEPFTETAARLAQAWSGPPAPPVRLLPTHLTLAQLNTRLTEQHSTPVSQPDADSPTSSETTSAAAPGARPQRRPPLAIGVRESDLAPAHLDLIDARDSNLLVIGDSGAGKTSLLRTLLRQVTTAYTPEELLVVVVDYRRGLLDAVDDTHLSRYCASAPAAAGTLKDLAGKLTERLPGPDVSREQLQARTWWSGPRALVVMDDHDLVSNSGNDPLAELLDLLPVARDVGLHLVVAQSAGGVAAAMMQPVLRRLRELGSQALLLSGPKDEGVIAHGARMQTLPPGRALHVARGRSPQLVQVALADDDTR